MKTNLSVLLCFLLLGKGRCGYGVGGSYRGGNGYGGGYRGAAGYHVVGGYRGGGHGGGHR